MEEVAGVVAVSGWERFPWLRAGFSTRVGGGTSAYGAGGEQNLGWTTEDDTAVVEANRVRLMKAVSGDASFELVTMRQVHGAVVQAVERSEKPLATLEGKAVLQGDGLTTREAGLMLGVQTADCVPILMADTRLRAVAAIHAGWRGTVASIAGEAVAAMRREFGTRMEDLVAAIGPSIGPCCFEVGDEVGDAFGEAFRYGQELMTRGSEGKLRIDLWEANRRQLLDAGVPAEGVRLAAECTACSISGAGRRKYFSYRAEKGITGRMLSVIGVVPTA